MGYPIRLSTDQWIFAPPRRFSQLVTAFFARIRQGIRHKPFSRLTILLFPAKTLRALALELAQQTPWIKHNACFPFIEFSASKIFDFAENIINETRSVSLSFPELCLLT